MTWRTHAVIGANMAWVTVVLPQTASVSLWLIALGAFGALLPDIDASSAKIHYIAGGVLKPFRNIASHRGFFHSFLCTSILFVVSAVAFWQYNPCIPIVLTLSYLSHPIIDGFNKPGVGYLYPSKKRIHLLPRFLLSNVGSWMDQMLFFLGMILLVFFILQHVDIQSFQTLLG